MKHLRFLAALIAIMLVAAACQPGASPSGEAEESEAAGESAEAAESAEAGADWPDSLVIGFVPSREAAALVESIQPIADHLSEELGIPVEGRVTEDYTGLVVAMQTGQAHIGAFGPFALLQAVDEAGAEIILQSERFGSATYHTQVFTTDVDTYCEDEPVENERYIDGDEKNVMTVLNCNGTDRGAEDTPEGPLGTEALENLTEGSTVSFVAADSASGYIFPVTIFRNAGFNPGEDIEELFAGSHDGSVIAVCEGQAEVGVSFDDARATETAATATCDVASEVVVFAYGPEIPNDGIAVAGDLPDDLKEAIKQALLDYAESEEGQEVLSEVYNITALTEPNLEALEIVRDAAEAAEE